MLWFKCTNDSAGDLTFLDRELPLDWQYVIVIDDVHVARANLAAWTDPVARFGLGARVVSMFSG